MSITNFMYEFVNYCVVVSTYFYIFVNVNEINTLMLWLIGN